MNYTLNDLKKIKPNDIITKHKDSVSLNTVPPENLTTLDTLQREPDIIVTGWRILEYSILNTEKIHFLIGIVPDNMDFLVSEPISGWIPQQTYFLGKNNTLYHGKNQGLFDPPYEETLKFAHIFRKKIANPILEIPDFENILKSLTEQTQTQPLV